MSIECRLSQLYKTADQTRDFLHVRSLCYEGADHMFLRLFLIAAAGLGFFVGHGVSPAAPAGATFEDGEGAYIAGKFDEARAAYAAAAASGAIPPKDRASSLRQLAVMAWRLDGDHAMAERRFDDALRTGADLSRTHVERARFFSIVKVHDRAMAAAEAAVASAVTATEREAAVLAVGRAIIGKLEGACVAAQLPGDYAHLGRARDLIRGLAASPPLTLELSEALLEIALRLDDGVLALDAWRSYAREGIDTGAWAPAARRLAAALPAWRKGRLSPRVRDEVFEGLRTSHFFDLAALVAADTRLPDSSRFVARPDVAEVVTYARTVDEIRNLTDAYYRDVANRRADKGAWRQAVGAAGARLWAVLRFDGARPPFTEPGFVGQIQSRFAAYATVGDTGGVEDMHYGHVFMDEPRMIEQYGYKAQIRRVALDRMVSNGYESWLWDGRQAHGGWAGRDRVYQVRPAYADGVLQNWDRLIDPRQRAEQEQRVARLAAADDELARKDPAAYLPGLAARLDWQGENAILDGVRAQGGQDLKRRFIVAFLRVGLDANFFAHEGRHVLDKQAFGATLDSEELEFRAKLSEIAFSEQPRLSFGPIMNPNIADKTSPHGRANKRIMQGLLAWMDKNRASIATLDPARPLLPQFDKLTDDQMRAAMRAMDPWAPKP
jgi:hypothetical protein